MAIRRIAVSPGQPFNIPENNVSSSISGSWITFGGVSARAVRVQAVYWSCISVGSILQIRDRNKIVWYEAESIDVTPPSIDMFTGYLTLYPPFEYFQSGSSGDQIVVFGEYI